jgi:hypothetical protein
MQMDLYPQMVLTSLILSASLAAFSRSSSSSICRQPGQASTLTPAPNAPE